MPYCSHPFKIDLCLLLATATIKGSSVRSINKVHKFGSTYYRGEKNLQYFFREQQGSSLPLFSFITKKRNMYIWNIYKVVRLKNNKKKQIKKFKLQNQFSN
jgi:hypothetical protein